jgi:hypothetical protein
MFKVAQLSPGVASGKSGGAMEYGGGPDPELSQIRKMPDYKP